jgi:hypothetical protein
MSVITRHGQARTYLLLITLFPINFNGAHSKGVISYTFPQLLNKLGKSLTAGNTN